MRFLVGVSFPCVVLCAVRFLPGLAPGAMNAGGLGPVTISFLGRLEVPFPSGPFRAPFGFLCFRVPPAGRKGLSPASGMSCPVLLVASVTAQRCCPLPPCPAFTWWGHGLLFNTFCARFWLCWGTWAGFPFPWGPMTSACSVCPHASGTVLAILRTYLLSPAGFVAGLVLRFASFHPCAPAPLLAVKFPAHPTSPLQVRGDHDYQRFFNTDPHTEPFPPHVSPLCPRFLFLMFSVVGLPWLPSAPPLVLRPWWTNCMGSRSSTDPFPCAHVR